MGNGDGVINEWIQISSGTYRRVENRNIFCHKIADTSGMDNSDVRLVSPRISWCEAGTCFESNLELIVNVDNVYCLGNLTSCYMVPLH